MDTMPDIDSIEKDCSALGGLFQLIINDMKGSCPVWEDFMGKATKLHSAIKATIFATTTFLEAFQKIADLATNSQGATKEIGKAMTRLCIRHKSIENKLKSFNCLIVDGLVNPLQDKLEEWKKTVGQLDKDHAKEYKKARQEIKRSSTDTVRLQKKMKKGKCDMQSQLHSAMRDVGDRLLLLRETEKAAVRHAMIEERTHFCTFISYLKPVVDEEISMLNEITHLQEIVDALCMNASDPHLLPEASEQVLADLKGSDTQWSYQTPPSSPSSLGSRKSSMCSISSINSSSSGSSHSPHHRQKPPPPGTMRLSSISSQDSGFTSQDTLFLKPLTPPPLEYKRQLASAEEAESPVSTTMPSTPSSVWADWPDPPCANKHYQDNRPHTISAAYEKVNARPSLSAHTFEPPSKHLERPQTVPGGLYQLPEHPPAVPASPSFRLHVATPNKPKVMSKPHDRPPVGPKPKAKPVRPPVIPDYNSMAPDQVLPQPIYMNTEKLAQMASHKHGSVERQESSETDTDLPTPTATNDVPTSSELADAIRELEASTAALDACTFDGSASRASFQSSSGYGTMDSTPSDSQDSVAVSEVELSATEPPPAIDKFSTIPRTSDASRNFMSRTRPCSTTDIPVVQSGLATIRRHSSSRPPPPVRRSSSISTRVAPPKVPVRSNSIVGTRPDYAVPQINEQVKNAARNRQNYSVPQQQQQYTDRTVSSAHTNVPSGEQGGNNSQRTNIINSLNAKFGAPGRKQTQPPPTNKKTVPPSTLNLQQGAAPPRESLLAQIQHGTSLRRTQCNDRSGPRIS